MEIDMKFVKILVDDRKEMMDFMEQQLHKTNAEVGTFFYDITNEKLFLTDSISVNDAPSFGFGKIKKTTRKLHPQIWNENEMSGNYMQCPGGRVFFNENEKTFDVMVGKWAEKYPQLLEQVKKRFHLENENVQLCYDSHRDIGNGFYE